MEILKGKKDRMHEVNMYVPQVDSVEISLDKKVNLSKALKRDGYIPDGSATEEYHNTLSAEVDNIIKRYPPYFAREVKPETVVIEDNKIRWDRETLSILSHNYAEWTQFKFFLKRSVLRWANVDFNSPTVDFHWELEKALKALAERINNLQSETL